MPNLLAGHVSLVAGTWALETLVKHYFDQLFGEKRSETGESRSGFSSIAKLRKEELLYDEAFAIVKCFMEVSTLHTVEDIQEFSNTRTPSSPWTRNVRVLVPMSCCDAAAVLLIEALGGEEMTRRVVGGTKWWQVRGLKGVEAQWIVMNKDLQEAKRRQKEFEKSQDKARVTSFDENDRNKESRESTEGSDTSSEPVYEPKMDDLRCILYLHGGGYYFGSIDQERYLMQRFARKTNSRLFAINYRLSPQYPFPCAIQDALAAYLFLIRPPPGSLHRPVNPAHIVLSGDSAGGGLTLALLQVLRDAELPMPAGSVLISPWCDLTHSFPSVHQNTKTDVMPRYGLALHKPSTLWPPPPDEMTSRVRAGLRHRIKEFVKSYSDNEGSGQSDQEGGNSKSTPASPRSHSPRRRNGQRSFFRRHLQHIHHRIRSHDEGYQSEGAPSKLRKLKSGKSGDVREAAMSESGEHVDLGASASAVLPASAPSKDDGLPGQTISVVAENGETLEIRDQIQFYTLNSLLMHPLVSPVVSYLGGLPPMLVIASDGEVLRDEIVYMAHKAANPEKYPVVEIAKKLYPKLEGIEQRHKPTQVHLQVYDETAHVLPVLFSFCTPAKFCFRAMAAFVKYATGMPISPSSSSQPNATASEDASNLPLAIPSSHGLFRRASARMTNTLRRRSVSANALFPTEARVNEPEESTMLNVTEKGELLRRTSAGSGGRGASVASSASSSPRIMSVDSDGIRFAGNAVVYTEVGEGNSPFVNNMIRERVSITGVVRALEAEEQLAGCQHPTERVGMIPELAVRRYLEGSALWRKKFKHTTHSVARHRQRNLDIARKETVRNVDQLQMHFFQSALEVNADTGGEDERRGGERHLRAHSHSHSHSLSSIRSHLSSRSGHPQDSKSMGIKEGLRKTAASWTWAWAIDGEERPPPSSIVARRDTEEARRLSKIADQPTDVDDHRLSGNNLWTILVNALSVERTKGESGGSSGVSGRSVKNGSAETRIVNASPNSKGKSTVVEASSVDVGANGLAGGNAVKGTEGTADEEMEVAASGRLSRLLSVRAKRHSLAPQLTAVRE